MRRDIRRIGERTRFALSITPMIDVVFLLLVYFLLTSGFVSHERLLRTEQAPPGAREKTEALALEVEPLVIGLARGDEGVRISLPEGLAPVRDAAALESTLRDVLLSPTSPRGMFAADHPVRVTPAADVPWSDVVGVFHAITRAGYRSIAFGGAR